MAEAGKAEQSRLGPGGNMGGALERVRKDEGLRP